MEGGGGNLFFGPCGGRSASAVDNRAEEDPLSGSLLSRQSVDAAVGAEAHQAASRWTSSKPLLLALSSLGRQLRAPHPRKEVFTLVFVLRIELYLVAWSTRPVNKPLEITGREREDLVVRLMIRGRIFLLFPRHTDTNALGLENELADFVFLALLACLDVFPAQHATTNGTVDVTDDMLSRDQVSWDGLVLKRIWQSRRSGLGVARGSLYQERSAVSTCEPFANDLRRETEVRGAFRTLDV